MDVSFQPKENKTCAAVPSLRTQYSWGCLCTYRKASVMRCCYAKFNVLHRIQFRAYHVTTIRYTSQLKIPRAKFNLSSYLKLTDEDLAKNITPSKILDLLRLSQNSAWDMGEYYDLFRGIIDLSKDDPVFINNALYTLYKSESDNENFVFLMKAVTQCLRDSRIQLTERQLSMSFLSLRRFKSHSTTALDFVHVLTPKVIGCSRLFTASTCASILSGMKSFNASSQTVRLLLTKLFPKIYLPESRRSKESETTATSEERYIMNSSEFRRAVNGMQRLSARFVEVRQILDALQTRIYVPTPLSPFVPFPTHDQRASTPRRYNNSPQSVQKPIPIDFNLSSPWPTLDLVHTLGGLRSMSSSHEAVQRFIHTVITPLLRRAPAADFNDPVVVAPLMYSLQFLDCYSPTTRELLVEISTKLRLSSIGTGQPLNSFQFVDCLYGMVNLSSSWNETLLLIDSFIPHASRCRDVLTVAQWCRALHGVHRLSSESHTVLNLLRTIIPKMGGVGKYGIDGYIRPGKSLSVTLSKDKQQSPNKWNNVDIGTVPTPQDIARGLSGLQNMRDTYPEVRALVKGFGEALRLCEHGQLTGQDIARSFSGLQVIHTRDPTSVTLIKELAAFLNRIPTRRQTVKGKHIKTTFLGLTNLKSERPEVRVLLRALTAKLLQLHHRDVTVDNLDKNLSNLQKNQWSNLSSSSPSSSSSLSRSFCDLFDGEDLFSILSGLRDLSSVHHEVNDLIFAMTYASPHLVSSLEFSSSANPLTISTLCSGLRGLCSLCDILVDSIHDFDDPSGMVELPDNSDVIELLTIIMTWVDKLLVVPNNNTNDKSANRLLKVELVDISNACAGLQLMSHTLPWAPRTRNVSTRIMETLCDAYIANHSSKHIDTNIDTHIQHLDECLNGLRNVNFLRYQSLRNALHFILQDASTTLSNEHLNTENVQPFLLLQTLLLFGGSVAIRKNVPQPLLPELSSVIALAVSRIPIPPSNPKDMPIQRKQVKELTEEILDQFNSPLSTQRRVVSFHGIYLNGFLADTVLVAYSESVNQYDRDNAYFNAPLRSINDPPLYSSTPLLEPIRYCSSFVDNKISTKSFRDFIASCPRESGVVVVNLEIEVEKEKVDPDPIAVQLRSRARDQYLSSMHNVIVKRIKLIPRHDLRGMLQTEVDAMMNM